MPEFVQIGMLHFSKDAPDNNTSAPWDGLAPVKQVRGAKRDLVYALFPPFTRPHPLGVTPVVPYSHSLRSKAMSTEVRPSLVDGLTAFTTRLDGLRADQNPDDLSDVLRAAFKQRRLYDAYISSLIGDPERARTLLEVFDKVCSVKCTIP